MLQEENKVFSSAVAEGVTALAYGAAMYAGIKNANSNQNKYSKPATQKTGNWSSTKTYTAEEANKWWKETMNYDNPPYKPGTTVTEIQLVEDTTFVRVYDGNTSGQFGGWLMKTEDIKGLNPMQIQDKFALPSLPKYVTDVKLPAGTQLRTGVVNPLEGWGSGGATQFDLMGQRVGEFVNPRPLP